MSFTTAGYKKEQAVILRYCHERLDKGIDTDTLRREMLQMQKTAGPYWLWMYYGETPIDTPKTIGELKFRNLIRRAKNGEQPQGLKTQTTKHSDASGDDWDSRLAFIKSWGKGDKGTETPPAQHQASDKPRHLRMPAQVQQTAPRAETKTWEERLEFMKSWGGR